jgi:glucosamine-6-phosphate deaminase
MKVSPTVFATPEQLGQAAAQIVADRLVEAVRDGRRFLLGCPSGRSPGTTYAALAAIVRERRLDVAQLVIVLMDDYLVPCAGGGWTHEDAAAPHSCLRFGREQIVAPLSAAAGPGRGIGADGLWIPDPADPASYDAQIAAAGGIDVFLLASGASDGHVAFNPPGSLRDSQTRVVELPTATRSDNLATFPSFGGDLGRVPTHGVTVGIATIADLSREVILLLHGTDKGIAAARLIAAESYDATWPATIFTDCRQPTFLIDRAAAAAAVIETR